MANIVGLLVVGNEILDGVVLDTNSQWIINRLKALSFDVKESMTVRDDISEISKAMHRIVEDDCGIIITMGGLGPTHDDMTLKGVAESLSLPLELNEEALAIVTRQYTELHHKGIIESGEITEPRRKMAVLPRGARPLDNRVGGAPGVLLESSGIVIFSLPGVPKELYWIFDNQILPILELRADGVFAEKIINLPLRDESTLAPIIDEVMRRSLGVYIKSMVKPYGESGIRLWISARGDSRPEVEERVSLAANLLEELTRERLPRG